ncbi:hypothetical protein Bca4012_031378 [Brassica carinata]
MNLCYHSHSSFLSPLPFECDWSPINKRSWVKLSTWCLTKLTRCLLLGLRRLWSRFLRISRRSDIACFSRRLDNPVFSKDLIMGALMISFLLQYGFRWQEEGYLALEKIIILISLEESAEEESLDVTAGWSEREEAADDHTILVQNFEDEAHYYDYQVVYSASYIVPIFSWKASFFGCSRSSLLVVVCWFTCVDMKEEGLVYVGLKGYGLAIV